MKTHWLISSVHPLRTEPVESTSTPIPHLPSERKRSQHKTQNVKWCRLEVDPNRTSDKYLSLPTSEETVRTKRNETVLKDSGDELTKVKI